MPQYTIPSFSAGLVDLDSQAKLDKSYQHKCSELTNFIIAPDDTIRRRPPLKQVADYPRAAGAIDFVDSGRKRIFLCNVPVSELEDLPEDVQKYLYPTPTATKPNLSIYKQTPEGLRATMTEVVRIVTDYTVNWELKANVQRIVTYDKVTGEHLPEESYLFLCAYHDSKVTVNDKVITLTSLKTNTTAGAKPDRINVDEIQEPAVFAIWRGNNQVALSYTLPYKTDTGIQVTRKNATDTRFTLTEVLSRVDNGATEFLFTDKTGCTEPIKAMHRHLQEGVTFSFAGLRYKLDDGGLEYLTGKRLLPSLTDMTHNTLKSLIPNKRFKPDAPLPMKVLYIPAKATGAKSAADNPFSKANIKTALTSGLIQSSMEDSNVRPLETLLTEEKVKGYTLEAFRGALPELAPVLDEIKTVVGMYEATDSSKWVYPDVKYLEGSADYTRTGEASFLYTQGTEDRTAVITTSVKGLGWPGVNRNSIPANSFPNGNGYAADGLGVSIALYKHIPSNPDTYNPTAAAPDAFLYIFLDYDSPEVQEYFKGIDLISGFSASFLKYRSFVAKLGSSASYNVGATSFVDRLTDANNKADSTALTDTATTADAYLLWPFGIAPEDIKNFGTPCYLQSLNPKDAKITLTPTGSALGGNAFVTETGEVTFDNTSPKLLVYMHNPRLYSGAPSNYEALPGRGAVYTNNKLYLSQVLSDEVYNNHVVAYFNSITNGTRDRLVLQASGLQGQFVAPIIGDPQIFEFKSRLGGEDNIVSIEGADRDNIYIGTENAVRRALPGSFLRQVQLSELSRSGVTSPIISESSYNIAATGDRLVIMRYYEEAKGVIADILAPDTKLLDDIDGVEQLISKHKLLFFYKRGTPRVYCGAMSKERAFKGLSVLEFPEPIHLLKQLSADKMGVLLSSGGYCEMDFQTDVTTDFSDVIDGKKQNFTSSVTSLPVAFAGETSFSSARTISISKASVGVAGFLDLEFSIVDDLTGAQATTAVRYVNKDNITEPKEFGGFWSLETLPTNGSVSPRIKLTKKDNKYVALSSVLLEIK